MTERQIVVVGYDAAELLDIACVTTTLATANRLGAEPRYAIAVATPGGRPIGCGSGLSLDGGHSLERLRGPLDTLVVTGGFGHEAAAANPLIVGHVRRLARESRRVASVCTGASVLAAAGLLDGRRATTHWSYAAQLAAGYPAVEVDPAPIFIRDGEVATAAGVTSALDLTLAFVAEDHGPGLARSVARALVTYLQRPGNQAQMSMYVSTGAPWHDAVRRAVDHVAGHLTADLGSAALAEVAGIGERQLTRLFAEQLGRTPGRFVRDARLEAAAQLLTTTSLPVARVAAHCGFRSAEALRQAFTARYGVPPSRFRQSMA
ncbi:MULTISPECIES: GlxA family transcriptional regulator [unclassified Kitasatospora]|uniref:GlxA family transcriptional regulator n=1 Tax=unclassified Kitasatospora TaxID=2633591 RepID=UPI0007094C6A|nr:MULTISPECIES: helix-turn-helix domain-containing protein [unclassified Kitasatospora]KQV23742.1 AraC family transcriptional regulator [Kitasatospora sp. Root107]KRB67545.1 AraC family transcriptional regulator [Kitasatospora sp. Root187]